MLLGERLEFCGWIPSGQWRFGGQNAALRHATKTPNFGNVGCMLGLSCRVNAACLIGMRMPGGNEQVSKCVRLTRQVLNALADINYHYISANIPGSGYPERYSINRFLLEMGFEAGWYRVGAKSITSIFKFNIRPLSV